MATEIEILIGCILLAAPLWFAGAIVREAVQDWRNRQSDIQRIIRLENRVQELEEEVQSMKRFVNILEQ